MEKKSTQLRWLVTMLLLVTAMAMPKMAWAEIALVEPTNGDGTSENPYQITTAAELSWFADKVNNDNANYSSKNAVLIADIDLEGSATNTWKPIGNTTNQFNGTFDGGGRKITGCYNNGAVSCIGHLGGVCGYNKGTMQN